MKKIIDYIKKNWAVTLALSIAAIIPIIGLIFAAIEAVEFFNEITKTKVGCFILGVICTLIIVFIIRSIKKVRDEEKEQHK